MVTLGVHFKWDHPPSPWPKVHHTVLTVTQQINNNKIRIRGNSPFPRSLRTLLYTSCSVTRGWTGPSSNPRSCTQGMWLLGMDLEHLRGLVSNDVCLHKMSPSGAICKQIISKVQGVRARTLKASFCGTDLNWCVEMGATCTCTCPILKEQIKLRT